MVTTAFSGMRQSAGSLATAPVTPTCLALTQGNTFVKVDLCSINVVLRYALAGAHQVPTTHSH
jgi:hypothetical protein